MPLTASAGREGASAPGQPRRAGWAAWAGRLARWTGWLLLALVSMTVAYGALVFAGR